MHFYGLNIRHMGSLYKKCTQEWLKNIFQAEMAARCLKNFFRYDIQACVLTQLDRPTKNERVEEIMVKRVISFLNVIFGNTESSFRLWRNLNQTARQTFKTNIWENDYKMINFSYFLQAIQLNLKIVLSPQIL